MQAYIENLIQRLLADYEQNRAQKWENITTLLNLLITASIGCYTYLHGATEMLISSDSLF